MARILGIAGEPNTGKSYSRIFIENPEEFFVLMPSRKAHYLKGAKPFEVKDGKPTGNFRVYNTPDLEKIDAFIKKLIDSRPVIKYLVLPDFTHFISNILSSKSFITRKVGGDAFQRFWELAADALNTFLNNISKLRDDLLVIIEFHSVYDTYTNKFNIFVPGGNMLTEKFKIDSYFDLLLYSYSKPDPDNSIKDENKYKFVVKRTTIDGIEYPARSMGIFEDIIEDNCFIPNNLQIVIDKIRENEHLI